MPNNVINEIVFEDVEYETQGNLIEKICNADGLVDFSVLVPMPLNVWRGDFGKKEEEAFRRTWYSWCRENWGTKWNAYDHHRNVRFGNKLIFRFSTAWMPPYPWLAAVFNYFSLPFTHNWLSEYDTDVAYCGKFRPIVEGLCCDKKWEEQKASQQERDRLYNFFYDTIRHLGEAKEGDCDIKFAGPVVYVDDFAFVLADKPSPMCTDLPDRNNGCEDCGGSYVLVDNNSFLGVGLNLAFYYCNTCGRRLNVAFPMKEK